MVSPCGFESHLSHQKIQIPIRVSGFLMCNSAQQAVKKTYRWHVFRAWESPYDFRCIPAGCRGILKRGRPKAGAHRDLYAPNRIFSRNTALKSHGRRQPCRGFLPCLAGKSLVLECFAVLRERFFLTKNLRGRRNTGCISRTMIFPWRNRFIQNRTNP